MIDIHKLKETVRMLLLLVDKAVNRGIDFVRISTADIFFAISARELSILIGCSHQTIYRTLEKLLSLSLPLPNLLEMSNSELVVIFYPKAIRHSSGKRRPPYELILAEKQKRPKKYGKNIKTIKLAYDKIDPATALSDSRFYELVKQYMQRNKVEMWQPVAPGECMYCDFAGMPVFYLDGNKKVKLHIFVAVMGYSKKMFACTSLRQDSVGWITCLVKALRFFGRSPIVIHFDNARAVVLKPGLIAELSDRARDFSRFFRVICDTSAVGTPKHNPDAEKSVQFIEDRVLVVIRDLEFFSQIDVDESIGLRVAELNNAKFQKLPYTREELFAKYEWPALGTLTKTKYPIYVQKTTKTATSGHTVFVLGHEYSVPCDYAKEKLTVYIFENTLRIYDCLTLIAEHVIKKDPIPNTKTILPEHMPPRHLHQSLKNKDTFLSWAKELGPGTVAAVTAVYARFKSPVSKTAGKHCLALKKLSISYNETRFETILASLLPFDDLPDVEEIEVLLKADEIQYRNQMHRR